MMIVAAGPALLRVFHGFVPDDAEFRQMRDIAKECAERSETHMSQTIIQAVFWIATLAVLVLYMQRRRKRKTW